jgi:hypothetical protein
MAPITVPVIRSIIMRPVIRRIIGSLIDGIRRRHIDRSGVIVRSGSSYRNAERRHNHRKTDARPSMPGLRLVRAGCQQEPEGQDCDQYCRKQCLHLSPPSPYEAYFVLPDYRITRECDLAMKAL